MKTTLITSISAIIGIFLGAFIESCTQIVSVYTNKDIEYRHDIAEIIKGCKCKEININDCTKLVRYYKEEIKIKDCGEQLLDRLKGGTMVIGKILDRDDRPISNASIKIVRNKDGEDNMQFEYTATNGFFFFDLNENEFSNNLWLKIDHKDYVKESLVVRLDKNEINTQLIKLKNK